MSELRIDSDRFTQVVTLISLWRTMKDSEPHRRALDRAIGYKRGQTDSEYARAFTGYLLQSQAEAPKTTTNGKPFNDPLPPEMEPDPNLRPSVPKGFGFDPTDPIAIWDASRDNIVTLEVFCKFVRDSYWDRKDYRKVTKPLEKQPPEINSILNDHIIDRRHYRDLPPGPRGLLELIAKAFCDWWENHRHETKPQPKPTRKFGDPA